MSSPPQSDSSQLGGQNHPDDPSQKNDYIGKPFYDGMIQWDKIQDSHVTHVNNQNLSLNYKNNIDNYNLNSSMTNFNESNSDSSKVVVQLDRKGNAMSQNKDVLTSGEFSPRGKTYTPPVTDRDPNININNQISNLNHQNSNSAAAAASLQLLMPPVPQSGGPPGGRTGTLSTSVTPGGASSETGNNSIVNSRTVTGSGNNSASGNCVNIGPGGQTGISLSTLESLLGPDVSNYLDDSQIGPSLGKLFALLKDSDIVKVKELKQKMENEVQGPAESGQFSPSGVNNQSLSKTQTSQSKESKNNDDQIQQQQLYLSPQQYHHHHPKSAGPGHHHPSESGPPWSDPSYQNHLRKDLIEDPSSSHGHVPSHGRGPPGPISPRDPRDPRSIADQQYIDYQQYRRQQQQYSSDYDYPPPGPSYQYSQASYHHRHDDKYREPPGSDPRSIDPRFNDHQYSDRDRRSQLYSSSHEQQEFQQSDHYYDRIIDRDNLRHDITSRDHVYKGGPGPLSTLSSYKGPPPPQQSTNGKSASSNSEQLQYADHEYSSESHHQYYDPRSPHSRDRPPGPPGPPGRYHHPGGPGPSRSSQLSMNSLGGGSSSANSASDQYYRRSHGHGGGGGGHYQQYRSYQRPGSHQGHPGYNKGSPLGSSSSGYHNNHHFSRDINSHQHVQTVPVPPLYYSLDPKRFRCKVEFLLQLTQPVTHSDTLVGSTALGNALAAQSIKLGEPIIGAVRNKFGPEGGLHPLEIDWSVCKPCPIEPLDEKEEKKKKEKENEKRREEGKELVEDLLDKHKNMFPNDKQPTFDPWSHLTRWQRHVLGLCTPCFFNIKRNRCDRGGLCQYCHYCSPARTLSVDRWKRRKNPFCPRPIAFWDHDQKPCYEAIELLYQWFLLEKGLTEISDVASCERIWGKGDRAGKEEMPSEVREGGEEVY